MRLRLAAPAALFIATAPAAVAQSASAPFTGHDLSGTYACTGVDGHEGAYTSTVTLEMDKAQSHGTRAGYHFKMEVPSYGSYRGVATADGDIMAITFAHDDPATQDYGTGIAKVTRTQDGKVRFDKFYYEEAYKGGNTGTESCVRN
ncbi:hypothetical protein [Nitrospirillum pindoramense]|uniref:Uncharacterized protein n=1 Tax=Nitrospirillum amazonense TaxID=28077 RepID=A0A560GVZ4_9PROT|nr:hypothetical protein [Nitrospirillum amazonense]TWB38203.1 hypothetical protein FBZ90_113201 [Nitrospirillum amazonense]